MESVTKSLKRLKCDYLTLFCHRYDETKEEVVRAMDDLIHQGKSYTGGPAWPGDKIQAAVDLAKTTTRIHRRATATTWLMPAVANEIVPICIKAGGIVNGFIAGVLTGKYDEGIPAAVVWQKSNGFQNNARRYYRPYEKFKKSRISGSDSRRGSYCVDLASPVSSVIMVPPGYPNWKTILRSQARHANPVRLINCSASMAK